jgi:hypothetical protein
VDDESADGTGELALGRGAYVARLSRNSGQGSDLRVGYQWWRESRAAKKRRRS